MLRTSKRSTSEWFHYSASKITKQQSFLKGAEAHGIHSRVKSGKGKENVLVAGYMIEKRCSERRSMITGPSSHNQQMNAFGEMSLIKFLLFITSCLLLWKTMNC